MSKSKFSSTCVGGGGGGGGGDDDGGGGGAPPPLTSEVYGIVHVDATTLSMSKKALPPSDAVEARLFAGFSEALEALEGLLVSISLVCWFIFTCLE